MLSRESLASSISLRSCRSCHCNGSSRLSAATMELLEMVSHAEERVTAAWTRIGLAAIDKENKWASFVQGRLCPFLFDYVRMQEAEELAIAAENDRLFHELFFASLRLKELPRSNVLAKLVEAVMAQEAVARTSCAVGDHLPDANVADIDGSLTLPSFVAVVTALASKDNDCLSCISNPREDGSHTQEEGNSKSSSVSSADRLQLKDPAWAALWQLARNMTHQELQRNLKSEVERMNAIADARLQELCLLHKQHALLQLPPQKQTLLRRRYAEKLFSGELLKTRQEAWQQSLNSSVANIGSNTTCERDNTTLGPSSGRATSCRSCHSVLKGELDLLSDPFCEGAVRVDCDCHKLSGGSGKKDSCLAVSLPRDDGAAGRGTVFEADLSDVIRFGRRQDLSLDRIAAETQKIYAEIIAQNSRMVFQANEELQCVEELWSLLEECTDDEGVCDMESKGINEEEKEECVQESEERVQSRHEFMCRLAQMQHEYEQGDNAPEVNGAFAADNNTLPPTQGKLLMNNINSSNNLNLSVQRVTRSSKPHLLSHFSANMSECGNSDDIPSTGSITSGTRQLPAPLVKLFTVRSYAPILSYIVTVKEELQRRLVCRHVQIAQKITVELTDMYRNYFEKTRDKSYSVAPDYSQWLQEHMEAVAQKKHRHHPHADFGVNVSDGSDNNNNNNNNNKNKNNGIWQEFLGDFTPENGNGNLRERIADVQYVVSRARAEAQVLRYRLQILNELEPLLCSRRDILEQQRALQEGSRERLLSKKVNMAKQLLFEENVRRQIARTLPKIYEQIEELLCKWNETMGSGDDDNTNCANRRLILHGVDVADVVRQFHEDSARGQRCGSRSPPPSSEFLFPFVRPQGTPRSVSSLNSAKQQPSERDGSDPNNNNNNNNQRLCSELTVSPPPRVTGAKTHAARRGPNPASSASPLPVKRVAVVAGRRLANSVRCDLPGGKQKWLSPAANASAKR